MYVHQGTFASMAHGTLCFQYVLLDIIAPVERSMLHNIPVLEDDLEM